MVKTFKIVFFSFFLWIANLNAQDKTYFQWVHQETALRKKIKVDTYELFTETSPGKWRNDGKVKLDPTILRDLPATFNINYFYNNRKNAMFFTVEGTQQVFEYHYTNNKLDRLDRTYYRGYNFKSVQFIRKDTIYSFGGNGFWTNSNVQTYYDYARGEWEALRPKNLGPKSINSFGFNGYSKDLDVFYSGGSELTPILEQITLAHPAEFYRYSFKANSWELLGKINERYLQKKDWRNFWDGKYFFIWAVDKFFILDAAQNKAYEYQEGNKYFANNGGFFLKGDTIYNYWDENGNIDRISIKQILNKAKYVGPFYEKDRSYLYYLLGAVLVVLLVTTLLWFRKRNNRPAIPVFDNVESKLLRALIEKGPSVNVYTHEINEMLGIDAKSQDNQRRIRVQVINQINTKIQKSWRVKNAIERYTSEEDKRLSLYRLNPEIQNLLKGIL